MKTLETRGLRAGSLFKLLFIGLLVPLFVLGLISGITSFFGSSAVMINGVYYYGIKGLLGGIVLGFILPAIFASILWCFIALGIWLWTRVTTITLSIK